MRRLALAFAALWLCAAYAYRLTDLRKPHFRVSALAGGQRHMQATMAWLEGAIDDRGASRFASVRSPGSAGGRMIVADLRTDNKLQRFASRALPGDWSECRLWLEENPETPLDTVARESIMQAVALCPGQAPLRLTAAGTTIAGLGPDARPPTLYSVAPLTAIDPEKVVQRIHRHDAAPPHPLLFVLGLLAMVPLLRSALLTWRRARRLRDEPILSGVLEHVAAGRGGADVVTIRSGARRVSVYVEQGELLSVGLRSGDLSGGDAMVVDGLRATVQGQTEEAGGDQRGGAYRGGESLRLRPGSVLVVGDDVAEARRRLVTHALRDAGLALGGAAVAAAMAAGLLW